MVTHAKEAALAKVASLLERIGDIDQVPTGKTWALTVTPTVVRQREIGWNNVNLPAINVVGGRTTKNREASAGTTSMYRAATSIEITVWIRTHDDPDTEFSKWLHDIELIFGDDYTLGGTVFDSEITGEDVELEESGEPIWRMIVGLDIVYRYYESDPSTLV